MDTEGDLHCTCDEGPFSTCPVCRESSHPSRKLVSKHPKNNRERKPRDYMSTEDYAALVKSGGHWR